MKQLHNIVAPLILFCLMAAVQLAGSCCKTGEAVSQQTQELRLLEERNRRTRWM